MDETLCASPTLSYVSCMCNVKSTCHPMTHSFLRLTVGYFSDRSTSRYGRRRPALVGGAVLACLGLIAMRAARNSRNGYHYIAALAVAITGLNVRCEHTS